jgi:tRNA pseudouridine55 synthase
VNGLLLIDKPQGITSHDVVARCRRVLGVRRIGHAGTLDPMATGLLVLGVGRATRLLRFLEAHDKTYEADVLFGASTSTQDAEGGIVAERDASGLHPDAVEAALASFRGEIEQVPPMMSAVKIGGERLWRKARRGEEVERPSRRVRVLELAMTSFTPGDHPHGTLHVRCSRGTYVRTIAADLGDALGVGAHLTGLRRTGIGPFDVADAVRLDDAGPFSLRPMTDAVTGYPRRDVDAAGALLLVQGKPLDAAGIDGPYAVFGPDGLVAMMEDRGEEARSLCVVAEA